MKRARQELTTLFPETESTASNPEASSQMQSENIKLSQPNLSVKLANLMRTSFGGKEKVLSGRITIRLNDIVKIQKDIQNLNQSYNAATAIMDSVRAHWEVGSETERAEALEAELCRMIFGSNFIERAGSNYKETRFLCKKIFRGEDFTKTEPRERSSDYEEGLLVILSKLQTTETLGASNQLVAIKGRMEVIQHANALKFFLERFCLENSELTEELILATHRILCEGHDHDDGTSWELWAGTYRDCEIAASSIDKETGKRKKSIFIRASSVPVYMRQIIHDFNSWITKEDENTDPFELASWLCTQFVNIHPFADGNGRMCRILLNGVLYKYTGLIACIGENGEEGRDEYLEIAVRSNKKYHEEDCDVSVGNQISHLGLTELVVKKVAECGERMLQTLGAT